MRTLFIPASSTAAVRLDQEMLRALPKPIGIVTTVQHKNSLKNFKLKNTFFLGTILGCDLTAVKNVKVKSYLFVGTGSFHPINLALKTNLPVFILDPFTKVISELDQSKVKDYRTRKKTNYLKFLRAKTIGILVSSKPGQQNLSIAIKLKKKLDKDSYIFIADTFDTASLVDFNFVDCFVNTACPRLPESSSVPMINAEDLGAETLLVK